MTKSTYYFCITEQSIWITLALAAERVSLRLCKWFTLVSVDAELFVRRSPRVCSHFGAWTKRRKPRRIGGLSYGCSERIRSQERPKMEHMEKFEQLVHGETANRTIPLHTCEHFSFLLSALVLIGRESDIQQSCIHGKIQHEKQAFCVN